VDAVKAMLAADAILAMPPHPGWYDGADAVADFLRGAPLAAGPRGRAVPTRANGQLAFGHYGWEDRRLVAHAISVLTLRGEQICEITIFRAPDAFPRFGLPDEIERRDRLTG
jgi:RNA polymerase sigma-70 factor, ECF subfamily